MTAEECLRQLVAEGCKEVCERGASCFFCCYRLEDEDGNPVGDHDPACTWLTAKKFLQQQDAARRFLEEMGERLEEGFKP